MSIMKKTNAFDLTEDEIHFLRGTVVPDEVKQYLSRQHENIGTKVSAYRKVAAAARAECEALLAVRDLSEIHGEMATIAGAKEAVHALKRQVAALEGADAKKEAAIRSLTAAPAMAVHSED